MSFDNNKIYIFDSTLQIIGSEDFCLQVEEALRLLKEKDAIGYGVVKDYISEIKESEIDGMEAWLDEPRFLLFRKSAFYSITWCASIIAHDAFHSKLFQDYQRDNNTSHVPVTEWTGTKVERKCIQFQLQVALAITSPPNEIEYIRSLDGTHHLKTGN